MSTGPDLTAELDAAEDIVTGRAAKIETEWGVRYDQTANGDHVWFYGTNERQARMEQQMFADEYPTVLVRRTVTYSPWEEVTR